MPSPFSLNSSLFVFTCPPLLCSCVDQMADTLMGPVLSNGAGLEFDTLTPPISAACHQEPHRMLSGKCLYCLLEFLWWVWVSDYRETWSMSSKSSELTRVGVSIVGVDFIFCCGTFLVIQIILFLDTHFYLEAVHLCSQVLSVERLWDVWMKYFGPLLPWNKTVTHAIL